MPGLWLFFLAVTAPLWIWTGILVKSLLEGPAERRREEARLAEIVALRRRYVGIATSDPGAHEQLGDALRSAGHLSDALDAYLAAERLAANAPQALTGAGPLAGSGLQTKIRLMRLEISQTLHPEKHGMTMATREVLCPLCKNLSPPKTLDCPHCGHPLPVDTFAEAWSHKTFRTGLLADTSHFFWKVIFVGLAIGCALAIPDPALQAATILAATIALAALFLKRLGNPER